MAQMNHIDTRERIINFLKTRGPSLPIPVAKHLCIDTLFASAFLSELASEKTIKISDMKVGGSPLYYLPGQEQELEKFIQYISGKEKEALLLLKEKLLLEDTRLAPAIRVAIRSLKDFAFPIAVNLPEGQKLFWRYLILAEEEAKAKITELLEPKQERIEKAVIEEKPKEIKVEVKEKATRKRREKQIIEPASEEKEIKPEVKEVKEEKPKDSSFFEEIKSFLTKKDIELIKEISFDKKEVVAKIRINSDLGKISLLLIANDKKKVTEADLIKAYQKAVNEKMPCYFLSKAQISGKMKEYMNSYENLMKIEKL